MHLRIHVPRTSTKRHVRDKMIHKIIWIKSGELMYQICVCYSNFYYMKVKQLEADYWLFNILYRLLEF